MSDQDQRVSEAAYQQLVASLKEKHRFLVNLLKQNRSSLTNFMFQQGAILTVMLGWFLSSKEARDFIQAHPLLRPVLILWIRGYRQRSNSAYEYLLDLQYMPKE